MGNIVDTRFRSRILQRFPWGLHHDRDKPLPDDTPPRRPSTGKGGGRACLSCGQHEFHEFSLLGPSRVPHGDYTLTRTKHLSMIHILGAAAKHGVVAFPHEVSRSFLSGLSTVGEGSHECLQRWPLVDVVHVRSIFRPYNISPRIHSTRPWEQTPKCHRAIGHRDQDITLLRRKLSYSLGCEAHGKV